MTIDEAIKRLDRNAYRTTCYGNRVVEHEENLIAIQALEKQIAEKPIFDFNYSDTLSKFHCTCGNIIKIHHDIGIMDNNDAPNYCDNCGQKLDWKILFNL